VRGGPLVNNELGNLVTGWRERTIMGHDDQRKVGIRDQCWVGQVFDFVENQWFHGFGCQFLIPTQH